MKKLKLFKTILIPSLGVLTLGTIAAVATSCGGDKTPAIDVEKNVCITANASSTLSFVSIGEPFPDLQYSTDGGTSWNTYSEEISISQGQTLLLKGNNPEGWSHSMSTYSYLSITGNVSISGNVMGLLDNGAASGEEGDITAIPCDYCFYDLFRNSTGITSISDDFLPATILKYNCYDGMFYKCISLIKSPDLPATNLAENCYNYMFYGCSNLTTAPDLPATSLAGNCYDSMFFGCSSLTAAPDLPAKTLADYCYLGMFYGCSNLTTAPDLPATNLARNCYSNMFYGCSSLTAAPDLPATDLTQNCYSYMFYGCSNLTTAPDLPATNLAENCYSNMFYGCSSLTAAPELPAKTLAKSCYESMFYDCSNLTTAPVLSATSLARNCYSYMFFGCSSLTTAPDLPATTLADYCYSYMFFGCNSLTSIRIGFSGNYDIFHFGNWVNGVSSSGTFYYKGSDTLANFGFPTGEGTNWTINQDW